MAREVHRLNVTLDPEHAARLARLAERADVQEGTLARALLSTAIEESDPDARDIVALLDRIPAPGSARTMVMRRARDGEEIALDEL